VSEEVAGLFGAGACAGVLRFENDGPAVVFVGVAEVDIPIGTRWEFRAGTPSAEVYRTGRSARVDAMDWSSEEGPVAEAARSLDVVSTVASPIVVEGRLWGAMSVSSSERLMPLDAEGRLGEFTEIVATAIANAESRKALAHLVDQQAALRRVATLVARGVRPVEMFSAVTEAVSRVIGVPAVSVVRYEADGTATELANYFSRGRLFPVGVPMNIDGTNILRLVRESGAAARIDDYSQTKGEMAEIVRRAGVQSTVGVPVVVAGRVWGTVVGSTTEPGPLPADTELRLADFTELLATALGNAESREALEQLFEEQAALRRVATLVAEGVRPGEIFSAVSEEISRLFDTDSAAVVRFDHDGQAITFVGLASSLSLETIVGARWELNDSMATAQVYRTGRSARLDGMDWSTVDGPVGEVGRSLGITSTVASPIVVEGRLWGAMHVAAKRTLSLSTEAHLVAFTELVATAIANADSKSELAASRRRIVTASDETRRRIERDLHDGAQQRLVSVALALRETGLDVPSGLHPLHERIGRAADEVDGVIDDLRELAQGIHPAILLERGLGPALRTLALRASVPVELDIGPQQRFPKPIEVGAYYVVSEALTNAAKHAHASHARVTLEQENGYVRLSINDDGIGGADATRGSGLLGLRDRVEALGGSLEVESAAGKGTSLVVTLPLDASTETTGLKV